MLNLVLNYGCMLFPCSVSPDDYQSVSGQIIQFNTGDSSKTHIININNDQLCEGYLEEFFSNITLMSGVPPIEVIVPRAMVAIYDFFEPECGTYVRL